MNFTKHIFCSGIILAASAACMVSCTDTWNDHYDASSSQLYNGTLMTAIESKAPDFAAVIKAVGYDRELNSDNSFTVWAPLSFNKDSILEIAKTDSATVVDKFIKNHISRYAISNNGTQYDISLLSHKRTVMSADKFGTSNIISSNKNIACTNGVLHLVDNNYPYTLNLYEMIENQYKLSTFAGKDEKGGSLYSFLKMFNADSLDENKSVSRGVDADGNKIWVDSVTIRNNTALKNMDAKIYEEDSSFIAILPSDKAFNERYEFAKNLLVFNPYEDEISAGACDSLLNYYANAFAMTDLFYNKNFNEHFEDSLKSTNYSQRTWYEHCYYSKQPKNMPDDKEVNDILSKCGDPIDCSNGTAYLVDEYPFTPYEQFFKKISTTGLSNYSYLNMSTDESGNALYTKIADDRSMYSGTYTWGIYNEDQFDEEGNLIDPTANPDTTYVRSFFFTRYSPRGKTAPWLGYEIPNTLSGTYDLYLIASPNWVYEKLFGDQNYTKFEEIDLKTRFRVAFFEKQNSGTKMGKYPSSGSYQVNPNGTSKTDKNFIYETTYDEFGCPNVADTIYLGQHTFKNSYYARTEPGVIIQIENNVTQTLANKGYTMHMNINGLVLKPHNPENDPADEPASARSKTIRINTPVRGQIIKSNVKMIK